MRGDSNGVLSCLERERLEEELTEARSRGRNLSRLRNLTPFERAALEGASRRRRRGSRTTMRSMGASGRRDGAQVVRSYRPSTKRREIPRCARNDGIAFWDDSSAENKIRDGSLKKR